MRRHGWVMAFAAVLIGVLYLGLQWRHSWRGVGSALSSRSEDIIRQDIERQESLRLRALHRAVSAEIAGAAQRGNKVEGLQQLADNALQLDHPGQRAEAAERLNKLRLLIPRNRPGSSP